MKINNSVIDNNTNVELSRSSYCISYNECKSKVFSYEVLSRPSSSEISYINNSYIGQPTCSPQSVGTHSDALMYGQRCSSLYVDGGTVSLLNTTMNTSDQGIYAGEVINSYHLDIRVTDPDGVWTPNASVSVNENGFWSLGSQNTGAKWRPRKICSQIQQQDLCRILYIHSSFHFCDDAWLFEFNFSQCDELYFCHRIRTQLLMHSLVILHKIGITIAMAMGTI